MSLQTKAPTAGTSQNFLAEAQRNMFEANKNIVNAHASIQNVKADSSVLDQVQTVLPQLTSLLSTCKAQLESARVNKVDITEALQDLESLNADLRCLQTRVNIVMRQTPKAPSPQQTASKQPSAPVRASSPDLDPLGLNRWKAEEARDKRNWAVLKNALKQVTQVARKYESTQFTQLSLTELQKIHREMIGTHIQAHMVYTSLEGATTAMAMEYGFTVGIDKLFGQKNLYTRRMEALNSIIQAKERGELSDITPPAPPAPPLPMRSSRLPSEARKQEVLQRMAEAFPRMFSGDAEQQAKAPAAQPATPATRPDDTSIVGRTAHSHIVQTRELDGGITVREVARDWFKPNS
jgi:hypothetical protein